MACPSAIARRRSLGALAAALLRCLVTLSALIVGVLSAPTTPSAGAAHGYDAGPIARVDALNNDSIAGSPTPLSVAQGRSTSPPRLLAASPTRSSRNRATNTGGARFVAGSNGVVTDLVGGSPNAVVLGKYPAYVNEGAATGARTFSMSDEAWNAMTPGRQWTRNQQFLDQAISRGSEIRLATPPTASNLTGWYAREIEYLTKQGYTISSDGARMIPPGG